MAYLVLTKAFLQAAATATMHCQPERYTHPLCYRRTNLQNGLHQLITCGQNLMTPEVIISCERVINREKINKQYLGLQLLSDPFADHCIGYVVAAF